MYAKLDTPFGKIYEDKNYIYVEIISAPSTCAVASKYPLQWVKLDEKRDETESFRVPVIVKSLCSDSRESILPSTELSYVKTYAVDCSELTEKQFKTLRRIVLCQLYVYAETMVNAHQFVNGVEKYHISTNVRVKQ